MKTKLSYIDFVSNCEVKVGDIYEYEETQYQVSEISLRAGAKDIIWEVTYYPVNCIVVRFTRELEEFKLKFRAVKWNFYQIN